MKFSWSLKHEEYRRRVREALCDLLPDDWYEKYVPQSYASDDQVEFSRHFCPQLAKRGLLVSHWPKAYGGEDAEAVVISAFGVCLSKDI